MLTCGRILPTSILGPDNQWVNGIQEFSACIDVAPTRNDAEVLDKERYLNTRCHGCRRDIAPTERASIKTLGTTSPRNPPPMRISTYARSLTEPDSSEIDYKVKDSEKISEPVLVFCCDLQNCPYLRQISDGNWNCIHSVAHSLTHMRIPMRVASALRISLRIRTYPIGVRGLMLLTGVSISLC